MIRVEYVLADDLPAGMAIDIVEDRGHLVFRIRRDLTLEEAVTALNAGAAGVISGGRWFQEWKGDIVTADPEGAIPPQTTGAHDSSDPSPRT